MSKQMQRRRDTSKNRRKQIGNVNRYACELLESRLLLSTITWTNQGSPSNDSDGFNTAFGGNSTSARNVVAAALLNWQHIISSFNYSSTSYSDTYHITIEMLPAQRPYGTYISITTQYVVGQAVSRVFCRDQ